MSVNITVRDLLLTYPAGRGRALTVLDIPLLDIRAGGSLAVVGPAGSGKTSLQYMLSGLERPQRGSIRVGDVDVATLAPGVRGDWRRRWVGLVYQDSHLLPGLDALANVLLPVTFDGMGASPAQRRRGLDLLARVGIADAAQAVETLSPLEMRRVALARALLLQPPLLLADEPTEGLDVASSAAIADLLSDLYRESGCTLVVMTRDTVLAHRFQGVCRLEAGRILETAG